jgi:hypothetical protein
MIFLLELILVKQYVVEWNQIQKVVGNQADELVSEIDLANIVGRDISAPTWKKTKIFFILKYIVDAVKDVLSYLKSVLPSLIKLISKSGNVLFFLIKNSIQINT